MRASIKRIIKNSWLNIKRQGPLTFATVSIMVMTISLVTFLYFFQGIVTFLVNDLENKVDVSVYFKRDALEEEVIRAKDEIGKISEVKNIEYLSKDEALARFTEKHKDDPKLLEAIAEVGDNPLLSSLSIKTWQANQYEALANFLATAPFQGSIEKVDYNQNKLVINKIFSISTNIRLASIAFVIMLGTIAVLVSFNTTRMAIYNAREEISIMRLVGASNWFIRSPFMVQGIIIAFFATIVTIISFGLLSFFFNSKFEQILSGFSLSQFFLHNFFAILFLQLITGIGLSVISSLIAMRKHLEV